MKMEKITLEEFETAVNRTSNRAPYGQNQKILKAAETEPMKMVFETPKQAVSKQTALYVVRNKLNSQVKIVRRNSTIFLGPGEYNKNTRNTKTR